MQFTPIPGGVCASKGFLAAGLHCGIRKNKQKKDLALIYSPQLCAAACTYTQNKVKGAPILVTRAHVQNGYAKAILCNSGNANTCNADGVEVAQAMCESAAQALGIHPSDVVVASTGVIGQPLPLLPITQAMPALVQALRASAQGSRDACCAIMTTDTREKEFAYAFSLPDGTPCHIGVIAKGSGMIHPNMATMLAFVTTDVAITPYMLQLATRAVVQDTFNMVSVDGDTSTNDMLCVLANGNAGNRLIVTQGKMFDVFCQALFRLLRDAAMALARDGEGATKLLQCTVTGLNDKQTAAKIAKSVITSSLVKTAMFGRDANWGRILCAIGYTDAVFDLHKVSVVLRAKAGEVVVCRDGAGVPFDEALALAILSEETVELYIDLHDGVESATAWGCDLTYEYVKINGEYRT